MGWDEVDGYVGVGVDAVRTDQQAASGKTSLKAGGIQTASTQAGGGQMVGRSYGG